jgi:RNA recognition motif-containing protein
MSGRPRGFAFVELADSQQAAAAIQKFDGFEITGRKVRVNEATERPTGFGPPRFGGPYGGGAPGPSRHPRPKGSRRNIRARKRSIW